ncbi:hypothetical protein SAMN05660649_01512 [Desulfotomaculum arcticum]|uniref:Uncharacterized protein n=2 Tax=Desulfotruncus TaxID=2867377 RepID=A0A1I2RDB1_9FIRM|nr:hypothetical protein SAMN05660649_01512 [Desulfotomaculum arcticum] [Desulfotruncus arcticus DSM 17038]
MLFDLHYGYPAVILRNGVAGGEVIEIQNVNAALRILDSLEENRKRALKGLIQARVYYG